MMSTMKAVLACIMGLTLGLTLMTLAARNGPENADDFRSFYTAAGLASSHRGVYSEPSVSPGRPNEDNFLPYIRIPSYAAALTPLARLPYTTARRVWLSLQLLALAGCVWLMPVRRARLAIALAFSVPVSYALVLGQDIGLVLLIAMVAAAIASQGRDFLAGLAASLIGIKISYLPAFGLVFAARSKRGLLGLVTGVAAQLAASFSVGGSRWPFEYLALLQNPLLDLEPRRMLSIRAIATSLALPGGVFFAGMFALFVFLWWAAKRVTLADGLLIALPLAVVSSPHCYVYDAVVFIPLLVRVASLASWSGAFALLGLTPIPYLALMSEGPLSLLAGCALLVASVLAATVSLSKQETTAPATRRFPLPVVFTGPPVLN